MTIYVGKITMDVDDNECCSTQCDSNVLDAKMEKFVSIFNGILTPKQVGMKCNVEPRLHAVNVLIV